MSATSLLQVFAFTSRASIPVSGVTVTVTDPQGRLLGIRQTNSSGLISPIAITVPDKSESLDSAFQGQPFTSVSIFARHPGYRQIDIQNAQVFPGVVTVQNLEMIPLSQLPGQCDATEEFNIPPQKV